jgi:hypothetical protein
MAAGYSQRIRRLLVDWADGKSVTQPATWNIGLSTANPADDYSGLAEPTSTGGYTRSGSIGSTTANWTAAPSGANDSATVGANAVAVNFPTSTAAWSTGASTLGFAFVTDGTTASGNGTVSNYISRATISSPQAVNASGITLSFAIGQFAVNITPV